MAKYIVGKSPNYWWPVVVRRPDPETAGAIMELHFKALFVPQGQDAALAEMQEIDRISNLRERARADREALASKIADWADLEDAEGKPVPFSRTALLVELEKPEFRTALHMARAQSMNGEEARLGN